MEDPEYYIDWGNDEGYSRYPSEREGYAIQYCEFEKTIEKGVEVEEMLVDMQIGARFYKHDFDSNFVSLPENYFDLYMYHMDYTDEIEQLPIYEEEFHEVQNYASYPFDVEQVFAARIEKMENEEEEQFDAEDVFYDITDDLVEEQNLQQAEAGYEAHQVVTNGYTVYEQLIASDWWWWQLSLDMPDQLLDIGNIVYQWVTLVDINGYEQPFTIGCKTTVGFSVSQIDYFQQDTSQTEALWSDSALVVGQTVNQQAQDLKEEPSIHFWSAGDEHAPEAEESYIEGNRVFVCSFAKELPKIGRNPNDFNKYFHIHVGARIYDSNIDREHEAIPEQEGDIFLTAPPSYDFAEEWYDYDNIPIAEGAYQRVVSSIALIVAIFALNF